MSRTTCLIYMCKYALLCMILMCVVSADEYHNLMIRNYINTYASFEKHSSISLVPIDFRV